jgi:hypothetical protein
MSIGKCVSEYTSAEIHIGTSRVRIYLHFIITLTTYGTFASGAFKLDRFAAGLTGGLTTTTKDEMMMTSTAILSHILKW